MCVLTREDDSFCERAKDCRVGFLIRFCAYVRCGYVSFTVASAQLVKDRGVKIDYVKRDGYAVEVTTRRREDVARRLLRGTLTYACVRNVLCAAKGVGSRADHVYGDDVGVAARVMALVVRVFPGSTLTGRANACVVTCFLHASKCKWVILILGNSLERRLFVPIYVQVLFQINAVSRLHRFIAVVSLFSHVNVMWANVIVEINGLQRFN